MVHIGIEPVVIPATLIPPSNAATSVKRIFCEDNGILFDRCRWQDESERSYRDTIHGPYASEAQTVDAAYRYLRTVLAERIGLELEVAS